jgi:hypothetical protein
VADEIVAVAEGPEGLFATVTVDGRVSVWSGPGDLICEFGTGIATDTVAVLSHRLAIASPGTGEVQIVVGSWTRGVAGFGLDGKQLWHRRDIRHVHAVRALPADGGAASVVGVMVERGPGLILGATGGTRHRIRAARFMAGGPDGSLLVHDGKAVVLRAAADRDPLWRISLSTFAVLDAVLDGEVLLCGADRPPQIVRVTRDGDLTVVREMAGAWIDFVDGGRHVVAADGTVAPIVDEA